MAVDGDGDVHPSNPSNDADGGTLETPSNARNSPDQEIQQGNEDDTNFLHNDRHMEKGVGVLSYRVK